jgi:hypothetical protein
MRVDRSIGLAMLLARSEVDRNEGHGNPLLGERV